MKPPAFQFYAANFLVGTADMEAAEVGAYIRLLCHQWDRGFVPKEKAARLAGAKVSASVLAKFVETDGELRNQRMEDERKKQAEYRAQQSRRGKAGAEARWDGVRHATANHEPMAPPSSRERRTDSSPSSSPSPSSDDPEPEAGAFAKLKNGKAQQIQASVLEELEEDDLRSDENLLGWWRYASSQPNPIIKNSEAALLNVFGAAVHALKAKKIKGVPVRNRVALFCSVVLAGEGKGGWGGIKQDEEDEGRRRFANVRSLLHQAHQTDAARD